MNDRALSAWALKQDELTKKYGIKSMCDPKTPFSEGMIVFENIETAEPLCVTRDDLPNNWPQSDAEWAKLTADLTSDVDWTGYNDPLHVMTTLQDLVPKDQTEVVVNFDLTKPLDWQLENIEAFLRYKTEQLGLKQKALQVAAIGRGN